MIGTMYAYEKQEHDGVICHMIMEIKSGCLGVDHFEKTCVDYADTTEEAIAMVSQMNAYLQSN